MVATPPAGVNRRRAARRPAPAESLTTIDRSRPGGAPYTRSSMLRRTALLALLALPAGPLAAQYVSEYELRYGRPVASLTDTWP